VPAPHAVILDFNGTLSDDEPLLSRIVGEVLREEAGVELAPEEAADLTGVSDPEIVARALRRAGVEETVELRDRILRARIDRYMEEVVLAPTIGEDAKAFVGAVAERIPVAIASGAFREEIELVLELAGIREHFAAVICLDDVTRSKPDPESYQLALAKLNAARSMTRSIVARDTLAIEDSGVGVAAAKAAGLACAAIAGDKRVEAEAQFVIERLDEAAAKELLGG